jgi:processive 1,2-diacylglycerol beta-glucosyltransferase
MVDENHQNKNGARPRVLLVTASVGTGHNQAARALEEELHTRDFAEVKCVDSLDFTPRLFRAKYAGGYSLTFTRFPFFYGIGFRLLDRPTGPGRTMGERYRLLSEGRALKKLADFVREFNPDVIVYTHFLAPAIIQQMIHRGEINPRQMMVVTDIKIHRWWYCESIDTWFLPQEASRQQLLGWNIDPSKIVVSGIPLRSKWDPPQQGQSLDIQQIRKAFSLPEDKKIVLLSGGTAFTCGPIERIARQLVTGRDDICVVVLGGRDKQLLGKLGSLPEARDGKIIPVGFTDRLHELMRCASLILTKAGGLITTECLATQLPMVILQPVPGQESGNAQFYAEQGAAVVARNAKQSVHLVHQLLDDESRLAEMSQNAAALKFPGRCTIVDAIADNL